MIPAIFRQYYFCIRVTKVNVCWMLLNNVLCMRSFFMEMDFGILYPNLLNFGGRVKLRLNSDVSPFSFFAIQQKNLVIGYSI